MKKVFLLGLVAIVAMTQFSCTIADSSEVAVVVNQVGNEKGEPQVSLESGFVFYFPPTQDVYKYPTNVQHKVWTASLTEDSPVDEHIDVTSKDGATFGLDVAFNFQLMRNHADTVFKKYRLDIDHLIETRLKTIVRKELLDNAVNFASDSLLQHRNVYEANVSRTLAAALLKEGFILNNVAITAMAVPDAYKKAIERKIQVIQETATVVSKTKQAEAQALQKVAVAKGDYEAALYDAKTKEILSQPKMIDLYKAETDRIWANKGVSPYGNNNVFGTMPQLLRNR
jgi:regulator of protease activity HflC (stomatin/prohibitin superfamily)